MPTKPGDALPDGLDVLANFLSPANATALFDDLRSNIPWQQRPITLFGKTHLEPRLTCWMGDPDAVYTYSGITNQPIAWTQTMLRVRDQLVAITNTRYNSVLLNLYRTGQDSMGWHSDDERELGPEPVIASLSVGGTRRFLLRRKAEHADKHEIALDHGSLLIMRGRLQQTWQHSVPKTAKPVAPRINLTFRQVSGVRP